MTNDKRNKLIKKTTENKSIYINHNEDFPSIISEDVAAEIHSQKYVSVCHVREELQNVIETMGPNTPLEASVCTTDNENDDTCLSIQSKISSRNATKSFDYKINEDSSQMTQYNVSEIKDYPKKHLNASVHTYNRDNFYPINNYNPYFSEYPQQSTNLKRMSRLANWFGWKQHTEPCKTCARNDLYKINIEQPFEDHSPPRRLVFDLIDELPKADTKTVGTNTKRKAFISSHKKTQDQTQKKSPIITKQNKETITERVDIYYFDHGNAEYYRTTDSPPPIKSDSVIEKTDYYTKKFWAEFFGTFNIGVSFVIAFILQFFRFILQAIIRPLTIGIVQLVSDYFFKPCLAVTFNAVVQPPAIFLYNFATSIRDICSPIADSFGYFIREFSVMLKAIRLVEINRYDNVEKEKQQN